MSNTILMKDDDDQESNNGYIMGDKFIPEELILELLCRVDYKTLVNCQLVCKKWNILIKNYAWKKKAERKIGRPLPCDRSGQWTMYYSICDNKFDKNLLKNHSGGEGFEKWIIQRNGGQGWIIESLFASVPKLPDDPVFEGKSCCFVTSYRSCYKYQILDLIEEGFHRQTLDIMQPVIQVSEYYSSRFDCPAQYSCKIELLTEQNEVMKFHEFDDTMRDERQNQWFKFEHEFKSYGEGLRRIIFAHGGKDVRCWAGRAKISGACIKMKIPDKL